MRRIKTELEDCQHHSSTMERHCKELEGQVDVAQQEAVALRMTINTLTASQASISAELQALKVRTQLVVAVVNPRYSVMSIVDLPGTDPEREPCKVNQNRTARGQHCGKGPVPAADAG